MSETPEARAAMQETPVLEAGARFEGLVAFRGAARVDGAVAGDVVARGTLFLSESGEVEGEIDVDEAVVAGRVVGVVRARRRIELRASATVEGDLRAPRVALAEGSVLTGRCRAGWAPDAPDVGA